MSGQVFILKQTGIGKSTNQTARRYAFKFWLRLNWISHPSQNHLNRRYTVLMAATGKFYVTKKRHLKKFFLVTTKK